MARKQRRNKNKLSLFFEILTIILLVLIGLYFLTSQKSFDVNSLIEEQITQSLEKDKANEAEAGQNEIKQDAGETKAETADAVIASELTLDDIYIPACRATTSHANGNDHEVHTYCGFTLCYRESYEVAEWVSYVLTKEETIHVTGRSNNFRKDPAISTGSATLADYKKSGYDRGHLAPAADMEWSKESVSDSFFMSNMTPQKPDFNRGIWGKLEHQVRDWAKEHGEVVVITGPILEKPSTGYASIGSNKVAVPEYFYKVLLAKDKNNKYHAIGFILPNTGYDKSFMKFCVTVDEVERRTSLDFFELLDDETENSIELKFDIDFWNKGIKQD